MSEGRSYTSVGEKKVIVGEFYNITIEKNTISIGNFYPNKARKRRWVYGKNTMIG